MTDNYQDIKLNKYNILTDESNIKFSISEINYPEIHDMYKTQQSCYWKMEEIDFSKDYDDFINLNKDQQKIIKMVLAFFANLDGIVNLNISEKLLNKITIREAIMTYQWQQMMENIHNECYAEMINNIIKNNDERKYLFNSIETIPCIKKMADWGLKFINDEDATLEECLVAFACVEGIMFSGMFAVIFWIKNFLSNEKTCMPGLVSSNSLIARDEGQHTDFACLLYNISTVKLEKNRIKAIVNECVEITKEFTNNTIDNKLIGLNAELMNKYIEYVGDNLLVSLGNNKLYKSKNPFNWMDSIGITSKTNFHEVRPTEYQSAYSKDLKNTTINFYTDDDF